MEVRTVSQIQHRIALLRAPDDLPLTTEEAGEAAGFAPATLRKWASDGDAGKLLPAAKRGGRNLYRAADIRRWLGLDG